MKKLLSILIVISLLCQGVALAAVREGLSFGKNDLYLTEGPIPGFPATIEATIKLSSSTTGRAGVVMGSYTASGIPCFNLEIYNNGVPRFFYVGASKKQADVQFSSVNVCKNDWVHLAIVLDRANSKALCYINGELAQTKTGISYPTHAEITEKLAVGGDQRASNAQYFRGSIKNIRLYTDMRTASEVSSDYTSSAVDKDDLLLGYDIKTNADGSRPSMLEDISGNGVNVYHNSHYWTNDVPELSDYSYSMAVIGDTTILSKSMPKGFNTMYNWLINNRDEKNISFVFGLGDMTSDGYAQYALADANFMNLNERIPFSFVRGETDTPAKFNEIFTHKRYKDQISGSYDGTMQNTYREFEAGQLKYLVLALDVDASDDVIEWANGICRDNPDRNIIVTAHAYLGADGNTLTTAPGKNGGAALWDKLIKQHANITMVLCGHTNTKNIVMSKQTGINGNEVTQLLINPSLLDSMTSGAGMIAMMYFSEDGKNVQLRYYSAVANSYFSKDNQFSFTVDTVEPSEDSGVTEIADINVKADDETSGRIDVNKQYAFTVDTTNGVSLKNGKLTMNISLAERSGNILAALYDESGHMTQIKAFDARKPVTVNFDNVSSGDKVKIMWWAPGNTMIPNTSVKWSRFYLVK